MTHLTAMAANGAVIVSVFDVSVDMPDVIVIGGGVVGLSIAWELAGRGTSVRVLERGAFGQESSWAGAGMLPPGNLEHAKTAEARLRGGTHQLWTDWSSSLSALTGMDLGYRRCGAIQLCFADAPAARSEFSSEMTRLRDAGIVVETDDVSQIRRRFPVLGPDLSAAYYLPDFGQVRNPWLLQALQAGCRLRGVEMISEAPVSRIEINGNRIESVISNDIAHRAAEYVVAGGAWSGELLKQIGISLSVEPVRGQIVLLKADPSPIRTVIEVGHEYLVPRDDGRILVGSTEEHVGFDKRNTADAIGHLIQFAQRAVPGLRDAQFEKCWAGLRPYSSTGQPYIGRLPQFSNACVATGHYRYGLLLSPITAVLIRQILLNEPVLLPQECLAV